MGSNYGWIKLHRQIVESDIWSSEDQEPFDRRSAWIYLLLIVNNEDRDTVFDGKNKTSRSGSPFAVWLVSL